MITPAPTPVWLQDSTRDGLHRLNTMVLELLHDEARLSAGALRAFRLLEPARQRIRDALTAQRWAAARIPVLLCDLRYQDDPWWQAAIEPRFRMAGVRAARRVPQWRLLSALQRAQLHFAWHIAQHDREGTEVLLGMSATVTGILKHCTSVDIERVAERSVHALKPRWCERPNWWLRLLADPLDDRAARATHIHAVQSLGARSAAASP